MLLEVDFICKPHSFVFRLGLVASTITDGATHQSTLSEWRCLSRCTKCTVLATSAIVIGHSCSRQQRKTAATDGPICCTVEQLPVHAGGVLHQMVLHPRFRTKMLGMSRRACACRSTRYRRLPRMNFSRFSACAQLDGKGSVKCMF